MKIENETPWNTEDLTEFLTPYLPHPAPITIKVKNLQACPGVKRERQRLCCVSPGTDVTRIEIISPKRVAQRTDTLDRLAGVGDLAAHEVALPRSIMENIAHALTRSVPKANLPRASRLAYLDCLRNRCNHYKTLDHYPVIRGDTKARTARVIPVAELQRRMRWEIESAEAHEKKAEKARASAAKLQTRILKMQEKERSMSRNGKSI